MRKAKANMMKHGVSFAEAATSLLDPCALVYDDPDSVGEQRFVLQGMSIEGRLLTVCYTVRDEDTIRLISARKSTRKEENQYAQGI